MDDSNTIFCSSKFPWERERISSKFIDKLARGLRNTRQPWHRVSA